MDPLIVICSKINPRLTILELRFKITRLCSEEDQTYFACTPSRTIYNEPGLELFNILGP